MRATYAERSVPVENASGVLSYDPGRRWATFEEPIPKWEGGKPLPIDPVLLQHLSHLLMRDIIVIFVNNDAGDKAAQYSSKATHLVSSARPVAHPVLSNAVLILLARHSNLCIAGAWACVQVGRPQGWILFCFAFSRCNYRCVEQKHEMGRAHLHHHLQQRLKYLLRQVPLPC